MLQLVTDQPQAANRIRELRGMRRLTLAHVADRLDVEPTTVERWEDGLEPVPDDAAPVLSTLLRVSMGFMLGREDCPMTAADCQQERAALSKLAQAMNEASIALPAKSEWRRALLEIRAHMLGEAVA